MKKHLLILSSLIIGAVSSNAQLINADFETWTTDALATNAKDPNSGIGSSGWWDFNLLNSSLVGNSPISVFQDSTAGQVYSQKYSAKIVTVALTSSSYAYVKPYGIPDTMGIIMTGNISQSGFSVKVKTGIPFTQRITQFNFYYQYMPSGVDTASCSVVLSHFSGGKRNTLGAGIFTTSATSSSFNLGTVNIFYDSAMGNPDTILIMFSSSSLRSKPKVGSTFIIDDATVTGINELTAAPVNVKTYPNPASTQISFSITSPDVANLVNIYDITGQKLSAFEVKNNFTTVNTASFASGLYFYQVYDKSGNLMKTGKFSISK